MDKKKRIDDLEKLKSEANARIAKRKGKDPALAQTYDYLILASIEVLEACDISRPFYDHGEFIDIRFLISRAMDTRVMYRGSVIECWMSISRATTDELKKHPPKPDQLDAIKKVTTKLELRIRTILGDESESESNLFKEPWWTDAGYEALNKHFWYVLRLTLNIQMKETDIIVEDYEHWVAVGCYSEYEPAMLPIDFLGRCTIETHKKIWSRAAERFRSEDIIRDLEICGKLSSTKIPAFPLGFYVEMPGFDPFDSYIHVDDVIKHVLCCRDTYIYKDEVDWRWNVSNDIRILINEAHLQIIEYFRRARNQCPPDSQARRKWLEAEAELIMHDLENPFTAENTNHLIALANDAVREYWIEERMVKNTAKSDKKLDQILTDVRSLKQDQDKHDYETGKRLTTLQKTCNGEHTRQNEKSKPNKKRVKDAVVHYYTLIAAGTKKHNAVTDACRETEKTMDLGGYKNFMTFRGAVNRIVKEREMRYGDKAASVSLDEI